MTNHEKLQRLRDLHNQKTVQRIAFVRDDAKGRSSCLVEVFDDGSAYVSGENVERIYEGSSQCAEDAVKFVESLGYVRA